MICLKLSGRRISLLDSVLMLLVYVIRDANGRLIVKQILIAAIWGQLPQFLIAMVVLFRCQQNLATSCLLSRSHLLLNLLLSHDVGLSRVVFKDQLGATLYGLFGIGRRR